jgi:hypothetical protein
MTKEKRPLGVKNQLRWDGEVESPLPAYLNLNRTGQLNPGVLTIPTPAGRRAEKGL